MLIENAVTKDAASGTGWPGTLVPGPLVDEAVSVEAASAEALANRLDCDANKRAAPRFTLLIRTAKLIAPDREYLCVVRDASQNGLKARVFIDVPGDTPLIVEFGNGERHPVTKVWQDGDLAGFRFTGPVQIERLLASAPEGLRKRSVRLRLALPITLTAGGQTIPATYRDISQHGACIHCEELLPVNSRIALSSPVLPPLEAHVRWRRAPLYGVIFTQAFRFDELAQLTSSLHFKNADAAARGIDPADLPPGAA